MKDADDTRAEIAAADPAGPATDAPPAPEGGRPVPGWLRATLEYGPLILFFVAYLYLKDETFTVGGAEYSGFIAVTAAFIPLIVASTGIMWALTGKLSQMQVVTVVLVVVFGGLSVWLNDERFFKMKPTLIYALFAAVLGFGLLRGRSYLSLVLSEAMPLTQEGWMILTRRMTILFVALAVANEAVWRTMSTDAWVNFKTFGLPLAIFAFIFTQMAVIKKHTPDA